MQKQGLQVTGKLITETRLGDNRGRWLAEVECSLYRKAVDPEFLETHLSEVAFLWLLAVRQGQHLSLA